MHQDHPLRTHRLSKDPKQSQAALADELGVTRVTVNRWEKRQQQIDEKLLPSIEQKTGIPAKELRPDLVEKLERLVGGVQ